MSACCPASTLCASVSPSLRSQALLKITLQAGFIPELSSPRENLLLRSCTGSPGVLQAIFLPVLTSLSRAFLFNAIRF